MRKPKIVIYINLQLKRLIKKKVFILKLIIEHGTIIRIMHTQIKKNLRDIDKSPKRSFCQFIEKFQLF